MQESKGERGFSAVLLSYVKSTTNFRPAAVIEGHSALDVSGAMGGWGGTGSPV